MVAITPQFRSVNSAACFSLSVAIDSTPSTSNHGCSSAGRETDVRDVEPKGVREPHAVVQLLAEPLAVARLHQRPDHLARLRPPEDVLREDRQHRVRCVDELGTYFVPG